MKHSKRRAFRERNRKTSVAELLEKRELLASDWHHAVNPSDVDANGVVEQRDLQLIVNDLKLFGARTLTRETAPDATLFLDPTNDGRVSSRDTLLVVNKLVAQSAPTASSTVAPAGSLITWDGGGGDLLWSNPLNWSNDELPGPEDNVTVDATGNVTVRYDIGTATTIKSLTLADSLTVVGGPLTVTSSLSISSGKTLTMSSAGSTFLAEGTASIDGVSLVVTAGTLSLPGVTSYTHTAGTINDTAILRATGAGSVLDLPNVTMVTGGDDVNDQLLIEALSGGRVNLGQATQLVVPTTGDTRARTIRVQADGTNSRVDLSAMTSFIDSSLGTYGGSNPGISLLAATNGGTIQSSSLTKIVGVALTLDATSTMPTAQLETISGLSDVTLNGGTRDFSGVATVNGSTVRLNGGTANFSGATNINGSSILVSAGGTLSLPGVTSYTHTTGTANDTAILRATGAGSVLDLPNVTMVTGGDDVNDQLLIEALSGGRVNLGQATQLVVPTTGDTRARTIRVQADGTNSRVDLSAMTSFIDSSLGTYGGSNPGISLLAATNGGTIAYGAAVTTGVEVVVDSTSDLIGTQLELGVNSTLAGQGEIFGNVLNSSGTVTAGKAPTGLTIHGDYTQAAGGKLVVAIDGALQNANYSQLVVTGAATLAGTLAITRAGGFVPSLSEQYPIVSADSVTGSFATVTGGAIAGGDLTPYFFSKVVALSRQFAFLGDLAPSDVRLMSAITPGSQQASISWTVANLGQTDITEPQTARFYLSSDDPIGDDLLVGEITYTDTLASGASTTRSGVITIPATGPYSFGNVRLVVVEDATGTIAESDETNNAAISDVFTVLADVTSPFVVSFKPIGTVTEDITEFEVIFSEPILASSFTPDDVVVIGPGGERHSVSAVNVDPTNPAKFFVAFSAPLMSEGEYHVMVGPAITDLSGNAMGGNASVMYVSDFESPVGSEWSTTARTTMPSTGRQLLGRFSSSSARLDLADLPAHTQVEVSFDLYIIGTWDGDGQGGAGVDRWRLGIGAPGNIIDATFSIRDDATQSYPSNYPTAQNQSRTGSVEFGDSGWPYQGGGTQFFYRYEITRVVEHQGASLALFFSDGGLQGVSDEGWAIDNVRVSVLGVQSAGYHASFTLDKTGPAIIDMVPAGLSEEAISYIDVTFDQPIQPSTFSIADVMIAGPGGPVAPTGVAAVPGQPNTFRVSIPQQRDNGVYSVTIGPAIEDLYGNDMHRRSDGGGPFSSQFIINIPQTSLTSLSPATATVNETAGSLSMTVTRDGDTGLPLVVSLASDATDFLTVPATVTIPAGQLSASFNAAILHDGLVSGNHVVYVTATAGSATFSAEVTINEIDTPTLTMSLAVSQVTEGGSVTATITRNASLDSPLVVTLAASNAAQLGVPSQVTIPAGERSVQFLATPVDDLLSERPESVTVTASAANHEAGSIDIQIIDDDLPTLTLAVNRSSIVESDGSNPIIATVSRAVATDQPVRVRLSSSDTTEASVPSEVIIPAGQTSVTFAIHAVNDSIVDGTQTVTIRAHATYDSCGCTITTGYGERVIQVLDDDATSLLVSVQSSPVPEGRDPAGTITITRVGETTLARVVQLVSSNPSKLVLPASVEIPAGQATVSVPFSTVDDGIANGSEQVIVTASSLDLSSSSVIVTVTDANLPDLVVPQVSLVPGAAKTGQLIEAVWQLRNAGNVPATGSWTQRVFLSKDPFYSGDDLLVGQTVYNSAVDAEAALEVNETITRRTLIQAPNIPGTYYVLVIADTSNAVFELNDENNQGTSAPLEVRVAYTATVSAEPLSTLIGTEKQALANTPVRLTGRATDVDTGQPAAGVDVLLRLLVNGTRRTFTARTNAQGEYSYLFTPLPGEAGHYQVAAAHPGVPGDAPQDSFTLLGIKSVPPAPAVNLVEQGPAAGGQASLQNMSNVPLSGLSVTVVSKPANIVVETLSLSGANLAGNGTATLTYALRATDSSVINDRVLVRVTTAEGVSLDIPLVVRVEALRPRLVIEPASLDAGAVVDQQTIVSFKITNSGGKASGPITLDLPQLPWLHVASGAVPELAPGASAEITLLLSPPASLLPATPIFSGQLVLSAAGGPAVGDESFATLPFTFRMLTESKGDLRVEVVDEFTYFAEGSPRVSGATLQLTSLTTGTVVATQANDADPHDGPGLFTFAGLAAGYYELRVQAEKHSPYRATILIEPGKPNNVRTFITRETVSYTWTVVPTEIEDRTNIVVETTFETNVPAPVVVVEPAVFDLQSLRFDGQSMQVNVTLTNHGLIAAEGVTLDFPTELGYEYAPLLTDIGTLPAKSSLTVPVIITRVTPSPPALSVSHTPSSPVAARAASPPAEWFPTPATGFTQSFDVPVDIDLDCPGDGTIGNIAVTLTARSSASPGNIFGDINPLLLDAEFNPTVSANARFQFVQLVFDETNHVSSNPPLGLPRVDPDYGKNFPPRSPFYGTEGTNDPLPNGGRRMDDGPQQLGQTGDYKYFHTYVAMVGGGIPANQLIILDGFAWGYRIAQGNGTGGSTYDYWWGGKLESNSAEVNMAMHQIESQYRGWTALPESEAKKYIVPFTKEDTFMVCMNSTLTESVATNDVDPSGTRPQASEYIKASDPSKGRVTSWDSATGSFTYIPDCNQFGWDYFEYYAKNGTIETCVEKVWIYIAAPISHLNTYYYYMCAQLEVNKNVVTGIVKCSTASSCGVLSLPSSSPISSLHPGARPAGTAVWYAPAGPDACDIPTPAANPLNDWQYGGVSLEDVTDFPILAAPFTDSGVCAEVRLQIDQQAIITRDAFEATLEITNQSGATLTNVDLDMVVYDSNGNDVTDLFGIRLPTLTNLGGIDGDGQVASGTTGRAQWIIIPTSEAAPDGPQQYFVGGTLSYVDNGLLVTIPLTPAPITVLPSPELDLKYFHQRDVLSDDPFTDELEPTVPFSLAVLVTNSGNGEARNMRIASNQPKIVDNEKGLLVDFDIIGTTVNSGPVSPSLTVTFGNIAPNSTAQAEWLLTSSIQGLFTEYKVSFEHLDGLGDKRLSLIKSATIHELIQTVQVDTEGLFDGRGDFLVNDVADPLDLPDTLHLSDGTVAPVGHASAPSLSATTVTKDNLEITLTVEMPAGYGYLNLLRFSQQAGQAISDPGFRTNDPNEVGFELVGVRRADGTLLPLENFWQTDRTFIGGGQRPTYERNLHLFDFNEQASEATYTLVYRSLDDQRPTILSIEEVTPDPRIEPVEAIVVTFSEPIDLATFDYQDILFSRDGGENLATPGILISEVPGTTASYYVGNLTELTQLDGDYRLTVFATGIADLAGNFGLGVATEEWTKGDKAPAVSHFAGVSDAVRNTPVGSIDIVFTEPVDASSLDIQDLRLTRNGVDILPEGFSVGFALINENTYRMFATGGRNLAELTSEEGVYHFTVDTRGVVDLGGRPGESLATLIWTLDLTPPTIESIVRVVTSTVSAGLTDLEITFSEPIDSATFGTNDLQLRRDGALVPLNHPGVNLTQLSANRYRLNGLAGVASEAGEYALSIQMPGIRDLAGNAGTGAVEQRFDRLPPNAALALAAPAVQTSPGQWTVTQTTIELLISLDEVGLQLTIFDETISQNLGALSAETPEVTVLLNLEVPGNHRLRVSVTDAAGNIADRYLDVFVSMTNEVDQEGPSILGHSPLVPARNTPVPSITISFSEEIDPTSFGADDLQLLLNGEPVPLAGVGIVPLGAAQYEIVGLGPLIQAEGIYQLSINATGIADPGRNAGQGIAQFTWTMDTTSPSGAVVSLARRQASREFLLTIVGNDPPSGIVPGSGLASYDVYVSTNGGPFVFWQSLPADNPSKLFSGEDNHTYAFHAIARDLAGNVEQQTVAIETSTYVPDVTAPATQMLSVVADSPAFQLYWTGSDVGGAGLRQVDVYVEIDGGVPAKIASLMTSHIPSGSVPSLEYQALADGLSHTYRFYTVGIDAAGNREATPSLGQGDVLVTKAFAVPNRLEITSFDIQQGAVQRSFIDHIAISFNQSADLQALVDSLGDADPGNDRVQLRRFDLNGDGTGELISLAGKLHAVDRIFEFDFGPEGIGGNRNTILGDGYYELLLDLNGDGDFETELNFHRLLGDVNGDRIVDDLDFAQILGALGQSGDNLDEDVNGDGVVNAQDRSLAVRSRGRVIGALPQ